MPRTKKGSKPPGFEQSLERLEAIVKSLEGGDLSLEESLRLFEEGVRLTRQCAARLDEAQGRIDMLTRTGQGDLKLVSFDPPSAPAGSRPEPDDGETET